MLLRRTALTYTFTAAQCQRILFLFETGDERISAAVILCGRVSDKDNMHNAVSPLNVSSKEELFYRSVIYMLGSCLPNMRAS
jgi:hypothetical protein